MIGYFEEKHYLMEKMLKQFVENEVRPHAKAVDEDERFPIETVKKMTEYGLMGIPFSEEEGGENGDEIAYVQAVMELSKACATTGVILSAHTSLCAWPISHFGTDAQKDKYLTKLNKGEYLGAFGLTEPNAGTDAGGQQTTAKDQGDHYLLNGSKIFITNAGYADIYIIFAMTEPSLKTRGITAFIVEKDMPGFSVGKKELKLGIRGSSTCELILNNVKVPKDNVLGKINKGFKVALVTLDGGRIGIAAQAVGIAEGAIEEALHYVKERTQFGRPISQFQNTQFVLAELETKKESAKHLTYHAALLKKEGKPYSKAAAIAKLHAAQTAMEVTTKALQLFGGYGYTREYAIERMMRDAKITEIYEGTNEAQKMVIAAHMLKGV